MLRRHARGMYPGWELAGFHHGYLSQDAVAAAIERINAARAHLLLVGMGNPLQELWIDRYRDRLQVPVSIGVGGLFDHWGGNLKRAPRWVRRHGRSGEEMTLSCSIGSRLRAARR